MILQHPIRSRSVAVWWFLCALTPAFGARAQTEIGQPTPPARERHDATGDGAGMGPLRRLETKFVCGLICVSARIGQSQERRWFLLDSGSMSVIDRSLAHELRLPTRKISPGKDDLTLTEIEYAQQLTLDLRSDGFVADFKCLNLQEFSNALGLEIAGILGIDYLLTRIVRIDYDARRVDTGAAEEFRYSGSGEVIPLVASMHLRLPLIACPDGGEGRGVAPVLDTGSGGGLDVCPAYGKWLRIPSDAPVAGRTLGIKGEHARREATLGSIRIGTYVLNRPRAAIEEMQDGVLATVGAEVLSRFKVTLDLGRNRAILEPGARFTEPFGASQLGFGVTTAGPPYDTYVVHALVAGGSGERAGLRENEVIVGIAGKRASELGIDGIYQEFRTARRTGAPLDVVVVRDGKEDSVRVVPAVP
jgi:hypothetical protein